MFDISFTEMLIIAIVALIIIGPERLPRVARTVGHLLGRARRYVDNVKNDIRHEIELDELRRLKNTVQETTYNFEQSMKKEFDQIQAATDLNAADKAKDAAMNESDQINASTESARVAGNQTVASQQTSESVKNRGE